MKAYRPKFTYFFVPNTQKDIRQQLRNLVDKDIDKDDRPLHTITVMVSEFYRELIEGAFERETRTFKEDIQKIEVMRIEFPNGRIDMVFV